MNRIAKARQAQQPRAAVEWSDLADPLAAILPPEVFQTVQDQLDTGAPVSFTAFLDALDMAAPGLGAAVVSELKGGK